MIQCPQCGKLNPENFNYCLDCGAELHPENAHSAESQFFIDLSSKSPDIEAARKEAGKDSEPMPVPSPKGDRFLTPGQGIPGRDSQVPDLTETKPAAPAKKIPTGLVLELSPDDLLDEINIDVEESLDQPLDTAEKPEEKEDSELQLDMDEPLELTADQMVESEPVMLEAEADQSDSGLQASEDVFILEDEDEPLDTNNSETEASEEDLEVDMSQAEEFKCWKCGAALLPDDRFCGQCGANTKEQPEESAGKTMFMHVGTSDSEEAHPVGKLTILEPSGREGRVFNVMAGENICGRTSGGILLDDDYISPEHCVFDANENDVVARDLQSQNGLYLKVKGDVELSSGSIVRVGQQVLVYRQLQDFETVDGFEEANATFLGSPSEGLWGKLVHITSEGKEMEHFPLDSSTLSIGREQGDISFPQDGFISGSHAKLSFKDGKCILTDLGSSNGTYLRVEEHKLANHDTLLIGQKLMRFEFS